MRSTLLIGVLFLVSAATAQTAAPTATPAATQIRYTRPDSATRWKNYGLSMFGPVAIGGYVGTAGILTWTNLPKGWGTHWDGYGKRLASSVGKGVISNTTRFALEEAFKLDSKYYKSQKRDFGSKVKNAFMSPFVARNETGKLVFGFPHLVGTYTGAIVAAEVWYPKRYDFKDGLKSGSISIGTNILFNLVKEFIHK
ncbi:MAG: hypothetical protein ACKVQJ_09970 [Pyrinomonadaceae bacterium]